MIRAIQKAIVIGLDNLCSVVDRLPNWTYRFVGTWLGCPKGAAMWSSQLDERWGVGYWRAVTDD